MVHKRQEKRSNSTRIWHTSIQVSFCDYFNILLHLFNHNSKQLHFSFYKIIPKMHIYQLLLIYYVLIFIWIFIFIIQIKYLFVIIIAIINQLFLHLNKISIFTYYHYYYSIFLTLFQRRIISVPKVQKRQEKGSN